MKVAFGGIVSLAALLSILFVFYHPSVSLISPKVSRTQEVSKPYPIILNAIFEDKTWVATLSSSHLRTVLVTGDVIPARSVNAGVFRRNNPLWPYEKVQKWFEEQHADEVFINLETPLISPCPVTDEGMIFCGDTINIQGLQSIGVTIASLANNHAGNYGKEGVERTAKTLEQNKITPTGLGKPIYKKIKTTTFAFLGFNDIAGGEKEHGIAVAQENDIRQQIQEAKKHADVVIVMFHWGIEYQHQPDQRQQYLAHFTIDNGADVILSNHPHWIQPIEIYKGKYIMYAHGNFIFDQMWSQKTREGVIGKYIFYDDMLITVQYFPLQINDYGQAHLVEGAQKETILAGLKKQSEIRADSLIR